MAATAEPILKGVRVLDLTRNIAGAYCCRLFADYGAEVIVVEPPSGHPLRQVGPFLGDEEDPERATRWLYLAAGKKSLRLDIEQPEGAELLGGLIAETAVVVESFAPGHLDSLGLGYRELRRLKRRIVLTSIIAPDPALSFSPEAEAYAGLEAFAASLLAAFCADAYDIPQHVEISVQDCLSLAAQLSPKKAREVVGQPDLRRVAHPQAGAFSLVVPPVSSPAIPWQTQRAPLLGEHNESILAELRVGADDLAGLRAKGII
ncbi:MAG TPA: CoA transferase [Dehalococcoidia bacterium]|nr:CoA transferase [Dehalococcoidia bacterium]